MGHTGAALLGSHDYRLVVLSILIAILASYVALDLSARATAARGGARRAWLTGAAVSMGLGIWSMYFVGMLAFRLPIPVRYDLPTVLLSLLAAILASAAVLSLASRPRFGRSEALRAEQLLRESEDRYRDLVEHSTDLICTYNLQGRLLSVNELPAKLLGYSQEELLSKPMRDFLLPEARAQFDESLLTIQRDGFVKGLMVVLTKSGERRIWEYHNTLRTEGVTEPRVRGMAHDVTERKRAEEALRSSEREQRQIAGQLERERARLVEAQEVAKIGSWEAELPSTNSIWSEQAHRIFETDPSRFHPTGPKFREFIHPEDRAKVGAAFEASLDKRSPCTVEYRIVVRDGRVKILEGRWQVFHDEEGKPVRVAGTCRDITERVRAEEARGLLSDMLLRSQDEERRRIAQDLHDSTGQNLVVLVSCLAQLQARIPSANRKSRKLVSESQALAKECIREVRTLSYQLHPPMLEEAGLGDAIRLYLEGFTTRSGIQVDLELSPQFGRLDRDVELTLFRVVQESFTNIRRHSGSLLANIRLDRNARQVTLEVSDKGPGISGRELKRSEGLPFEVGIGIKSMQERTRLIGGRLDIESSNSGTTVRVTIPLERSAREKAAHSGG